MGKIEYGLIKEYPNRVKNDVAVLQGTSFFWQEDEEEIPISFLHGGWFSPSFMDNAALQKELLKCGYRQVPNINGQCFCNGLIIQQSPKMFCEIAFVTEDYILSIL